MKKILLGCFIVGSSVSLYAEEIVVYGPSSMKWIEKKYAPIFNEKTGDTLKFVSIDGILGRLKLEKNNPKADIVVGMTELTTEMAKNDNLLEKYVPKNINLITNNKYKMDSEYVVPIDYGYLGINYNKKEIATPPKNIDELGKMSKKLILENPKVSITGTEALQWSIALYGDNWKKFWTDLKPAVYSVEPGWSEAFAKFTAGEAPMMIGYATSNMFFTGEDANKYDTFLLDEGSFMYQEGASLVKKNKIKDGAKKFMDEILSDEFQNLVMEKNYMFPVTNVKLLDSFKSVPVPEKSVKLSKEQIKELAKNLDKYKEEMINIVSK